MNKALDSNSLRLVPAAKASCLSQYICPGCHTELTLYGGRRNAAAYFAHRPGYGVDCEERVQGGNGWADALVDVVVERVRWNPAVHPLHLVLGRGGQWEFVLRRESVGVGPLVHRSGDAGSSAARRATSSSKHRRTEVDVDFGALGDVIVFARDRNIVGSKFRWQPPNEEIIGSLELLIGATDPENLPVGLVRKGLATDGKRTWHIAIGRPLEQIRSVRTWLVSNGWRSGGEATVASEKWTTESAYRSYATLAQKQKFAVTDFRADGGLSGWTRNRWIAKEAAREPSHIPLGQERRG